MHPGNTKIAGIILAAGMGSRMGRTKQLLPLDGIPLLQHVMQIALAGDLDRVIVVLGHDSLKIRQAIDLSRVTVIENPHHAEGQSSSLKAGLQALESEIDAALFLLADQPSIDVDIINSLVSAYRNYHEAIIRPSFNGKPGNPVLMDKQVFPALMELDGDQGGRGVFEAFRDQIRDIPVAHGGIHTDLDRPEEYEEFLETAGVRRSGQYLLDMVTPSKNSVVSVVGAGGKTTTIFRLARELKNSGWHVLITTTTAMFHPDRDEWPYDQLLLEVDLSRVRPPKTHTGSLTIAAGRYDKPSGKIRGYGPEFIDGLKSAGHFDVILVEADGSKMMPIKAPGDREPVVPTSTDITLGLIGLSSLDQLINSDTVHRPHLLAELSGVGMGTPVTERVVISLIESPCGLFKGSPPAARRIVILNQADTMRLLEAGRRIRQTAAGKRHAPEAILVCCLHSPQPVLDVIDR